MFHKENIWNLLSTRIPSLYTKLLFIDADVIVQDPMNWTYKCSQALDTFDIVQPLSVIKFQEAPQSTLNTSQPLLVASSQFRPTAFDKTMAYPSPGYGIAVKRKWLKNVGGFIDSAVVGAGDLFTLGLLCAPDHVKNSQAYLLSPFTHKECERYEKNCLKLKTKLGFISEEGFHLYHGQRNNRQYANRHELMKELQEHHLMKNTLGLIEFTDARFNTLMLEYFKSRNEDSYET
jgi:hypothetical protein